MTDTNSQKQSIAAKANACALQAATPLTIALFTVAAGTGLMMFFHMKSVEGLHIWTSLAFTLAAFLHSFRNWRALKRQFLLWPVWAGVTCAVALVLLFATLNPSSHHAERGMRGGPGHPPFDRMVER